MLSTPVALIGYVPMSSFLLSSAKEPSRAGLCLERFSSARPNAVHSRSLRVSTTGSNTKRSPDKIIEGLFQGHVGTLCEDAFANTPLYFTTGKRLGSPDSSLSRNSDSLDAKLMVSIFGPSLFLSPPYSYITRK
jgi:hypothetical protein